MSLGLLRFSMALVFLFFIKLKLAPGEKLKIRDIPLLFGAGLSGVTLYFFFENNGVSLITASEASIAVGCIPVFTMTADWLREKIADSPSHSGIRARQWLGTFISIAGVWLVAGVSLAISGSVKGYVYMIGAAASWVSYSFLTRPLFVRCSRIHIVFWQTVSGFICFIPFAAMEFSNWGTASVPVILHLTFLGLCCSALGYLFYATALETLGAPVCAIFINLIPVVTVIGGFIIMGDRLAPLQWFGAALVIGGVYLSMWEKRKLKG